MAINIVYIASLAHSGSTLLNLLLGACNNTVALGEVALSRSALGSDVALSKSCSCGAPVMDCALWGPVAAQLQRSGKLSYVEYYRLIVEQVERIYASDVAIVESSKTLDPLEGLGGHYADALRTIYLIRDVRGYIVAARKRCFRKKRRTGFAGMEALRWYRQNRAVKARLDRMGLPYFQLGYEEFCTNPAVVFGQLSSFTGVDFDTTVTTPSLENSHILRGNRMRKSKTKMSGIRYDDDWRSDPWLRRNFWAVWPFLRWNNKNVYGNLVMEEPH